MALGGPTRGRLHVATGKDGELRSGGLDVGFAGTILVVGSRIDAETLTRARAMGVRGVIVSGFASKERRDFLASEARQRAALHRLPPFAVLVLDGAIRRPLAGPVQAVLDGLDRVARSRSSPTRRCSCSTRPTSPSPSSPAGSRPRPGGRARRSRGHVGRAARACDGSPVASTWRPAVRPAARRGDRSPSPLGDLERFG